MRERAADCGAIVSRPTIVVNRSLIGTGKITVP